MVHFKKPRNKTIVKFLTSKGWTLEKKTQVYYVMKPPKEIVFENNGFRYYVPVNESAIDYDLFTFNLVSSIAQLYEIKRQVMFDVFSKTIKEIKTENEAQPLQMEMKKAMLGLVAS